MPPTRTIGSICADKLKAAKAAAINAGRTMSWDEVAKVINDAVSPAGAAQLTPASFGDRKKVPPTPEQVTAYSAFIGYPLDGQAWCDSYAQKGWKVGKVPMKDWQASVRTWKSNGYQHDAVGQAKAAEGKDYTKL